MGMFCCDSRSLWQDGAIQWHFAVALKPARRPVSEILPLSLHRATQHPPMPDKFIAADAAANQRKASCPYARSRS